MGHERVQAPNVLREYADKYGWEATSVELSRALGREISVNGLKLWSGSRTPPKDWLRALGIADAPAPGPDLLFPVDGSAPVKPSPAYDQPPGVGAGEEPSEGRAGEQAPRKPSDAQVAPPAVDVTAAAQKRIAALHAFAGSAVATAVDSRGFESDSGPGGGIARLWTDKSEPIAEMWVQWAREGNRFAQSFVRLMAAGGAGGELVFAYAVLLGGTAYIMGSLPDNEATRFAYAKYARYRPPDQPAPAEPEREPEPEPDGNGAGRAGQGEPWGPFGRGGFTGVGGSLGNPPG